MNCCRTLFTFVSTMLLSVQAAHALIEVPHTSLDATIDGDLEEPLWGSAFIVELTVETSPAENTPATVKTTAYLVRNDEYLYIAFVANDPRPALGKEASPFSDKVSRHL